MRMQNSWLTAKAIANKGLHDNIDIPENSMSAVLRTIDANYNILLNVALTKDNKLAVIDGKDLFNMCGVHKKMEFVKSDKLNEFKLLYTEHTIPLLADVLKQIDGKIGVIFKISSGNYFKQTVKVLSQMLSIYTGDFAILTNTYNGYGFIKKHFRKNLCGLILKNKKNKYLNLTIQFMQSNYFKLLKPDFFVTDINTLPNKNLENYLTANPYTYILSELVSNEADYFKAIDFSDNFIFEAIRPKLDKE